MPRFWICMALGAAFLGCASSGEFGGRPERTGSDRPDDFSGEQVHLMYVLPSDRTDEWLDTNGTISKSVAAIQKWLADQSGGYQIRIDTSGGRPDITFVRLALSDAEISPEGDFARDKIEAELHKAGFNAPDKIYAVYYGGGNDGYCGGGPQPPSVPGNVIALYLKGIPKIGPPCEANPLGADRDRPGYWEFSMLHEIFHAFGAVNPCAYNHDSANEGHTKGDPNDLMYGGKNWTPSVLDPKYDYFDHGRTDCHDVARDSPFLKKPAGT